MDLFNRTHGTAMLSVPSVDGKTHSEDEFTEWADCVEGEIAYAETTERPTNTRVVVRAAHRDHRTL